MEELCHEGKAGPQGPGPYYLFPPPRQVWSRPALVTSLWTIAMLTAHIHIPRTLKIVQGSGKSKCNHEQSQEGNLSHQGGATNFVFPPVVPTGLLQILRPLVHSALRWMPPG